jgi:hypothetical protein
MDTAVFIAETLAWWSVIVFVMIEGLEHVRTRFGMITKPDEDWKLFRLRGWVYATWALIMLMISDLAVWDALIITVIGVAPTLRLRRLHFAPDVTEQPTRLLLLIMNVPSALIGIVIGVLWGTFLRLPLDPMPVANLITYVLVIIGIGYACYLRYRYMETRVRSALPLPRRIRRLSFEQVVENSLWYTSEWYVIGFVMLPLALVRALAIYAGEYVLHTISRTKRKRR